jgi:hypothetical protein
MPKDFQYVEPGGALIHKDCGGLFEWDSGYSHLNTYGAWNALVCQICHHVEPEDEVWSKWNIEQLLLNNRSPSFEDYLVSVKQVAIWKNQYFLYDGSALREAVVEACARSLKYKDGKRLKDTWLRPLLQHVLMERLFDVPRTQAYDGFAGIYFLDAVLSWAVEQSILTKLGSVDKAIPYAYSHRFGRGIKGHSTWIVLRLNESRTEAEVDGKA